MGLTLHPLVSQDNSCSPGSRPPKLRNLISLLSLLGSFACSDPEQDAGCPSGHGEFGLAGCAVLVGQVLGNLRQPLSDISVSFRALRPCSCTESGAGVDPQGRFSFTVNRLQEDLAGDTLSVIVRAVATGQ